ncbi:hypothetical protein [Leptolyngbya sp. O-77]|nr:hypothetical protein [Leptolyngbya sp. O-77]
MNGSHVGFAPGLVCWAIALLREPTVQPQTHIAKRSPHLHTQQAGM